ncbi:MAG: hypothetical protein ACI91B_002488 [Planctomycetota bacterium]|jgi:hypothetical protein
MNFLKTMDLYKGIILMSVLLLPAGGWWVNKLQTNIESCEKSLRDSKGSGGWLEEIGSLQKKIEVVAQNSTSTEIGNPPVYFEGQIMSVTGNLKATDFNPKTAPTEKNTVGKQKVSDHVVDVTWGKSRDKKSYQMDFIYAVLFNCESGAKTGAATGAPSVWRLRRLSIQNASSDIWLRTKKTPEPEMEDKWYIKDMKFARREPRAK